MPSLSLQTPTIVHHMAALDEPPAPPNSLEAVQACLQAGARCIEVDITALADADYLLVHDAQLEAETSGRGPVAQCSVEQARSLMIRYQGVQTPYRAALLSDVVRLFQHAGGMARLQLDYKDVYPREGDEAYHRLLRLIEPLGERVIVSSGADWELRRLRKLAPWLVLGFDVMWYIAWQPAGEPRDSRDFPRHLGAYGYYDDHLLASARHVSTAAYLRYRCESLVELVPDVSAFYLEYNLIAQSLRDGFNWAAALHDNGILLDAWTMDMTNPAAVRSAQDLLAAGVDLFTTNTPYALASQLGLPQERPSR